MRASAAILSLVLLIPCLARADDTLHVSCEDRAKPKHVKSSVSYSADRKWRAYIEVEVRGNAGCTYTSQLWAGPADEQYRVAYVIPPEQYMYGNGMEIVGWAQSGSVLLVKTDQWQMGSDALDSPGLLAMDAESGLVYKPDLGAMLETRKSDRCYLRISDAALARGKGVNILVRAQFKTYVDVDDSEKDVPREPNCNNTNEFWSFDFNTGRIRHLSDTDPFASELKARK